MQDKTLIGWREWVGLPDLDIQRIKAKIDTGARTSSLDVSDCEIVKRKDGRYVRFTIHHGTRKFPKETKNEARVVAQRNVTNSGGYVEQRFVIETRITIGLSTKIIEITLTRRKGMKFRMLLGRTALGADYIIDSSGSYLTGNRKLSNRNTHL